MRMATPAVLKPITIQQHKPSRTKSKGALAEQEGFSAPPVLRRKPLLPFVQREKTRHGRVAYYFRRAAGARRTQRNPTTPSIDRIVPSLGYVKSNCRVVTIAINTMLLDWGEDLFLRMANAYKRHKPKRRPSPPSMRSPAQ